MSNTPRSDAAMVQVIANGEVLELGYSPLWVTSRALEKELAEALEALRDLYDEQNGPPLITDEATWQAAMDRVGAVLRAHAA